MSLSKNGAKIKSTITETPDGRYKVCMHISDLSGEMLDASIVVSSRSEAEKIKSNFDSRPDSVYRGILFSATGTFEYIT